MFNFTLRINCYFIFSLLTVVIFIEIVVHMLKEIECGINITLLLINIITDVLTVIAYQINFINFNQTLSNLAEFFVYIISYYYYY